MWLHQCKMIDLGIYKSPSFKKESKRFPENNLIDKIYDELEDQDFIVFFSVENHDIFWSMCENDQTGLQFKRVSGHVITDCFIDLANDICETEKFSTMLFAQNNECGNDCYHYNIVCYGNIDCKEQLIQNIIKWCKDCKQYGFVIVLKNKWISCIIENEILSYVDVYHKLSCKSINNEIFKIDTRGLHWRSKEEIQNHIKECIIKQFGNTTKYTLY